MDDGGEPVFGSEKLRVIKDEDTGEDLPNPSLLDGEGKVSDEPVYIEFRDYDRIDFNYL